jgi:hypothetical protein
MARIDVPGLVDPSFVWIASAPPSVFRPNSGFDPGISVVVPIARSGMRSQLTTSPNGWFRRTPSKYADTPWGVPRSGDRRVAAIVQVGLERVALNLVREHAIEATIQEVREIDRAARVDLLTVRDLDRRRNLFDGQVSGGQRPTFR